MADHSDGLLLMNYDEHQSGGEPGPIASQDWFLDNLKQVLKTVPKEKSSARWAATAMTGSRRCRRTHRQDAVRRKKAVPEKVL